MAFGGGLMVIVPPMPGTVVVLAVVSVHVAVMAGMVVVAGRSVGIIRVPVVRLPVRILVMVGGGVAVILMAVGIVGVMSVGFAMPMISVPEGVMAGLVVVAAVAVVVVTVRLVAMAVIAVSVVRGGLLPVRVKGRFGVGRLGRAVPGRGCDQALAAAAAGLV